MYFDKELFEIGNQLRLRKRSYSYPKKETRFSLALKKHYSNFKKMNVYENYILHLENFNTAFSILEKSGHKKIFTEIWEKCEEFRFSGIKIELFYLKSWDWLLEFESHYHNSNNLTYIRLLEIIPLFGIKEKDLILTEPAKYIFDHQALQ